MSASAGSTATRVTQAVGNCGSSSLSQLEPRSLVVHTLPSSVPTYSTLESVEAAATVVIVPNGYPSNEDGPPVRSGLIGVQVTAEFVERLRMFRSEERRVGKECRSR